MVNFKLINKVNFNFNTNFFIIVYLYIKFYYIVSEQEFNKRFNNIII